MGDESEPRARGASTGEGGSEAFRRTFLSASAVGLAGAGVAASSAGVAGHEDDH